jgi:lipopolysaccharide export system protein LptA
MFKNRFLVVAAAAALSVPAAELSRSAHADPLAVIEGEALDVSADRLDLDVERGTALLQGNVSANFGDLDVHCPSVEIRYDRSPRVSFARGTGGVSAHLKGIDATAASVEFDAGTRSVSLQGNVRLTRGRGWLTADRATIDVATGRLSLQEVHGSIPVEQPRH